MRGIAMLFTTHVDVATFAQDEQRKSGEHHKSDHNFPHTISFKKKGSQGEPVIPLTSKGQGVNSTHNQSLA